MLVRTGPGRARRRPTPPSLLLYNFDIDGDRLKPEHEAFLMSEVVPTLRNGGSITIVGLASRAGDPDHNQALSEDRAKYTLKFLQRAVPTGFNVRRVTGFGERQAALERNPDGTENPLFRSVVIFVAPGSVPPPPPPPPLDVMPNLPDLPAPGDSVLDTLGQILDWVGFGAGLLELVASGFLVVFAELAGLLTGVLSAVLAVPGAWLAGDRLAEFNGTCQGFWNALQDMANQYSSPALDAIPVAAWPPVRRPAPHLPAVPDAELRQSVRAWRAGEQDGARRAYETVMRMELRPMIRTVTVQGRQRTVRLSGRMFLRVLSHHYRDRVADAVRTELNRRLRNGGRREWPVTR
jgi:hypothetical protein